MDRIPTSEVRRRIEVENPWWAGGPAALPHADLRPRAYLDLLAPLVADTPVRRAVVLLGPRRVGKTVVIHHLIGRLLESGVPAHRICYVSVDHPLYTGSPLEELLETANGATGGELLGGAPGYVFFDEIQYLRDWERHLKVLVDSRSGVRFLASGSAAAALRLRSQESGAGRFTEFLLPPLTFHECLLLLDEGDAEEAWRTGESRDVGVLNERFVAYLNFGGYPEVLFSHAIQADPQRFIKADIVDKVLLRDLPSLYGIQDIQELNALFTTLAYHTASEVSLDGLAKNSGVAKNTIRRYIEYLEAAFLIRVVHRVDRSGKRFKRANFFKVYLTNPTMRSALFAPLGPDDGAMGRLVETGLFCQFFHAAEPLYYGRWHGGEVDLVRLAPNLSVRSALEIKWSDRHVEQPGELTSLLSFCRRNELTRASVTTRTMTATREVSGVTLNFMPAARHALFVGAAVLDSRRFAQGEIL